MLLIIWYIPIVGHPSAGKSSLIRILTGGKKVAVGKKSGTTKKITPIQVSENLTILDFPGYGKVSHRSKSFSEYLQQTTVDYLEEIKPMILVGIVITDLSNIELMSSKFDNKGFIPIDFELTEFLFDLSNKSVIVLGNKIDKLPGGTNYDKYLSFLPKDIVFFPVSLKHKSGLDSFLIYLQMLCDEIFDELHSYFWKYT